MFGNIDRRKDTVTSSKFGLDFALKNIVVEGYSVHILFKYLESGLGCRFRLKLFVKLLLPIAIE